jgi:hypothetical protein
VPNCKSVLFTEADRKHGQATRTISTTSSRYSLKIFSLQGKAPKEIHAIMKKNRGTNTIVCHRQKTVGPV